jgi:hypothetical protein
LRVLDGLSVYLEDFGRVYWGVGLGDWNEEGFLSWDLKLLGCFYGLVLT